MIEQVRAQDVPANRPAVEGNIRAVRVVSCTPGSDTIAFNSTANKRTLYTGGCYRASKNFKIERIYLTGTPIIEYTTDPDEEFDGGAGAPNIVLSNPTRRSYKACVASQVIASGAGAYWALDGGPVLTTRIRRIRITIIEPSATAATVQAWILGKTTAASSGGAAQVPQIDDDVNDSAFSGVFRSNCIITPAAPFVAGAPAIIQAYFDIPATANVIRGERVLDYVFDGLLCKPVTIGPGGAKGVAMTCQGIGGGNSGFVAFEVWFTEE